MNLELEILETVARFLVEIYLTARYRTPRDETPKISAETREALEKWTYRVVVAVLVLLAVVAFSVLAMFALVSIYEWRT
jgi:hypothetical protein